MARFCSQFTFKTENRSSTSLTSVPCNSVTKLSLVNCNLHDDAFPKDYCYSSSLEFLDLSKNPVSFLPDCFKGLKRLKNLKLRKCKRLQALEDLPNLLIILISHDCPLLEKITFHKPDTFLGSRALVHGCKKLLEMESGFKIVPIDNIDPEFIHNYGLYWSL